MKFGLAHKLCVAATITAISKTLDANTKQSLADKQDELFKLLVAKILVGILHRAAPQLCKVSNIADRCSRINRSSDFPATIQFAPWRSLCVHDSRKFGALPAGKPPVH
jgi:hypothetical protein